MEFVFFPYSGVNNLKYGMSRKDVRNILGIESLTKEFYRTTNSENSCDVFHDLGVFVNYDNENKCEAIEFFGYARVIFQGQNLLNLSYSAIAELVGYLDDKLDDDDKTGFTSFLLGLGVYAPEKLDNPNQIVESIITFKKGYYG